MIGDAAHAMPPTSAQGANQAFEDGWTLATLLLRVSKQSENGQDSFSTATLKPALEVWCRYRQSRIDQILALTDQMNGLRLPLEEQIKLKSGKIWKGDGEQESDRFKQWKWLFSPDWNLAT